MPSSAPVAVEPTVLCLGDPGQDPEFVWVDLACRFYGLAWKSLDPAQATDPGRLLPFTETDQPVLVVVPAGALDRMLPEFWPSLCDSLAHRDIPVAVIGIKPDSPSELLHRFWPGWSLRARAAAPGSGLVVTADEPAQPGFALRGLRFDFASNREIHGWEVPADFSGQVLAAVGASEQPKLALLVRSHKGDRYLLAGTTESKPTGTSGRRLIRTGEWLPYFLLIREAGGPRCWQAPAVLANLTIDDPRLVEPYGRLSFPGLLAEMERTPFHATIGFIPWNYDRNDPAVIALFRDNPRRLSLAVHGNNHEGYEFFRYEAKPGDTQRSAPLDKQAFNIRQGLARIRRLEQNTGLAVDRVMVFPQAISPAPTLEILRSHGFWATANFSNVPLDATVPGDPMLAFRSALTAWHEFPALRRDYPHQYSDEAVALDLFLGNPVLFMAHQDDFAEGIAAFTPHAQRVNLRYPAVRWSSLGDVARHLHRVRQTGPDVWQVQMVSRVAAITNPDTRSALFQVFLPLPELPDGIRVTRDGATLAWEFKAGAISLEFHLPPGGTSLVEVHYPCPADEPATLARSGLRKRYLRMIADFRDRVVSTSKLGQRLTKFYYQKIRRPALKSGRGRRRIVLVGNDRSASPQLASALQAELPPDIT